MIKLHFSISPVQSFISKARRTADFWGGSYIISYLSGHAIVDIQNSGGEIVTPNVEDDALISYIKEKKTSPIVGTLPNRFTAIVDEYDAESIAKSAELAVKNAWKELADEIWRNYIVAVESKGKNTKEIWDRQIEGYWEIMWALGEDDSILDQRKNWRTHFPPDEGGDKCTSMGDWQELSGYDRSRYRKKQEEFWSLLRDHDHLPGIHILKEKERLCAMALVKRMIPWIIKEFETDVKHWPSTVYMAALPWIKEVHNNHPDKGEEYARNVLDISSDYKREDVHKHIISLSSSESEFIQLDANLFFEDNLKKEEYGQNREELSSALKKLQRDHKPHPFYSMLVMDGDRIGRMLHHSDIEQRRAISEALVDFANEAVKTVNAHDGVTIYAGGDDVMAILPTSTAMNCSKEISTKFKGIFKKQEMEATISAGLIYAHYNLPLQRIIEESHNLLDKIAKDQNGRSSIAVSAMKSSGKNFQWCTTWDHLDEISDQILSDLKENYFSNSYLYNVMELITRLSKNEPWNPGDITELDSKFSQDVLVDLLTAEIDNPDDRKKEKVKQLLNLCFTKNNEDRSKDSLCIDGIRMLKFLQLYGNEVSK